MSFVAWFAAACLLLGPQSPSPAPPADPPHAGPADAGEDTGEMGPIRIGPVLVTGYAQFDGLFPLDEPESDQQGSFRIRRARAFVSGNLTPKIGFMASADAVASPMPLDVYVTLRHIGAANIRVGQFVSPYSLERLTSVKELEIIDRVIDRFTPSRDLGVMVFNATPFWGRLSYSAAVVNGTGQNTRDDNNAKDVVGRLAWTMPGLRGVKVGVNGASGRQPAGMRRRWGADVEVERGAYHAAAEYLHQAQQDWNAMTARGFYILGSRRFSPTVRRSDFYMAEAVVRFVSLRDPSELTGGLPGVERRELQAGGNYYFSRNVRVMGDVLQPVKRAAGAAGTTISTRLQFMF